MERTEIEDMDYESSSAIRIFSLLILEGVRNQATKILLRPSEERLNVSYLINDEWCEATPINHLRKTSVLNRIRIIANIEDDSEGGKFTIPTMGTELEIVVKISSDNIPIWTLDFVK